MEWAANKKNNEFQSVHCITPELVCLALPYIGVGFISIAYILPFGLHGIYTHKIILRQYVKLGVHRAHMFNEHRSMANEHRWH